MYVRGTKIPHSIKKIPSVMNANGKSLKTVRSGVTLFRLPIGLRGKRLLTKRFMITKRNSRMKPRILVAQAKPTDGKSF